MKKTRIIKDIKFFLFVFAMCIVVFFGYFIIKGEKNPLIGFIEKVTEKEELLENYNGIYTYYDDLNGSKYIFSGCSVSKIANHILIIDDDYFAFRSSCMGTYVKGSGKTKDLVVKLTEDKKDYFVTYDGKRYSKDYATMQIVPNNDVEEKLSKIELASYQLLIKETQFPGNYYSVENIGVVGLPSSIKMNIEHDEYSDSITVSILNARDENRLLYTYNIDDYDNMPDMYAYGKDIVVIEKGKNKNNPTRLGYTFKVVNESGIVYRLDDMFPITINDVTLNSNNSIFITFDQSKRVYRMLVGFDERMCSTTYKESEKDDIIYYEFTIDYNYLIKGFDKPKFEKIGYKSEGCKYVSSVMGG